MEVVWRKGLSAILALDGTYATSRNTSNEHSWCKVQRNKGNQAANAVLALQSIAITSRLSQIAIKWQVWK